MTSFNYYHTEGDGNQDLKKLKFLFLCTSPRSGSHRLMELMFDVGLGIPAEYFNEESVVPFLNKKWNFSFDFREPESLQKYWGEVISRRSRNNIVCSSIFGSQINIIKKIDSSKENTYFIHLYRRNIAEQVASLIAVYKTGLPLSDQIPIEGIPVISEISERSIKTLWKWISLQNIKWKHFLSNQIHISIAMEDLFDEPNRYLTQILDLVGWRINQNIINTALTNVKKSNAYTVNLDLKQKILKQYSDIFKNLKDSSDHEF